MLPAKRATKRGSDIWEKQAGSGFAVTFYRDRDQPAGGSDIWEKDSDIWEKGSDIWENAKFETRTSTGFAGCQKIRKVSVRYFVIERGGHLRCRPPFLIMAAGCRTEERQNCLQRVAGCPDSPSMSPK